MSEDRMEAIGYVYDARADLESAFESLEIASNSLEGMEHDAAYDLFKEADALHNKVANFITELEGAE